MYDFSTLTRFIHTSLTQRYSEFTVMLIEMIMVGLIMISLFAVLGLLLVYIERKVSAFMQMRIGPNRVGFKGTAQTIADAIKLLLKEGLIPDNADKLLFNMAPFVVVIITMLILAPIPFAKGLQVWDMNLGIFYITAVSSLGVIGILMAGWASNNKYSLIGAMRSGAQILSYELSVALSLLVIVTLVGSLSLSDIVLSQSDGWWIFKGHIPVIIAFVIFIISSTAELNRTPFDLPEAESELTAGFHTEYSGMRFALFFLAEYVNLFIISAIAATLFLGGWMPFHIANLAGFNHVMDYIPSIIWFTGKTFFIIFIIMWFRWTFPRLRIDKLLTLEWKYLMPISIINLVFSALISIMGWHF